ncbi:hypothetical protein J4463_04150 [Candidatus Pacearchaeota archaeon]|nr:hypothetical protein [Candidatus Pacearchaeota archaeon]
MEKTEFEREREKFIESHKEELCTIYSELCQMRDYSLRNDLENFRRHQAEFSKLETRVFDGFGIDKDNPKEALHCDFDSARNATCYVLGFFMDYPNELIPDPQKANPYFPYNTEKIINGINSMYEKIDVLAELDR